MTVKTKAYYQSQAIKQLHGAVIDFGNLIKIIRDNTAGDISLIETVPARVATLIAQKTAFDNLSIPDSFIKLVMETEYKYTSWDTDKLDFAAIFTDAPALSTAITNNINLLTQEFSGTSYQLTVSGDLKTQLESALDNILQYYDY